jgi:hypothetical protein
VSEAAPRLSVLLLTEDGDDRALRTLMTKVLGRLVPGAVTREDARAWEPVSPEARAVAQANGWKNPRRRDLVSFRQYIASKLLREHGFVFFHVDGDRSYREHVESPHRTENAQKLESMIRKPVRIILEGPPPQRRPRTTPAVLLDPAAIERRLGKLILVMPCYSLEAWLFQNTEEAARHCPGAPVCRHGCADKLAVWSRDRSLLDEVHQPKGELCFGAKHNAELASAGYPLDAVLGAEKSLYATSKALERCPELLAALERAASRWTR